jgi:PAS domain S-box-containing protein
MALIPRNSKPAQNKPVVWTGRNIVNAYTLIAIFYCLLSTLLFYTIAANRFLSAVHGLALVTIVINFLVLQRSGNYQRATNIILATGTVVVLSLFGTGGWESTGFLWPFAYLPFVVFLSSGKNSFYWAVALVAGCVLLAVFHFAGLIVTPYSPVVLANYFAALLIFLVCLYFFRKTTLEAEQALLESEGQVQAIFNSAPDAVIVIDQEGHIIQWNPKAETLFGWTAVEVLNKLLSDTIIPHRYRAAHQKGMEHYLNTGAGPVLNKTIEIQALTKGNQEFDVALRISPTLVKDRHLFIGFLRDITDQKKADEKIKHLNATLEQRITEREVQGAVPE